MLDVYLITDGTSRGPVVESVRRALQAARGTHHRIAVQLRAKSWPHDELVLAGHALRAITREVDALLIVNSHISVARIVAADGVHLADDATAVANVREELGVDALIGRSCHDAAGLARAAADNVSFATLSPVYSVAGKGPPLGIDAFRRFVRDAPLPVLALGGIDPANVADTIAAGASGVAVRSNVLHAADPAAALGALCDALEAARVLDTARDASGRS